jgi:hypothetical protein
MLSIALGAMILGCLLLVQVWSRYGFETKVSARSTPVPAIALEAFEKNPTVHL